MARNEFTLVLSIDANVSPLEGFEPLSVWIKQEDGTRLVTQKVTRDGAYLVGESGHYTERLVDVVTDPDRFVSLTAIR